MSKCISIEHKKECCGCTACQSVCPKQSISTVMDNEGFFYPQIDAQTCVDCGLCKKACPIINVSPETPIEQKAYIVQHTDEKVLQESTSGGAFTGIADEIIKKGRAIPNIPIYVKYLKLRGGSGEPIKTVRWRDKKVYGYKYSQMVQYGQSGRMIYHSGVESDYMLRAFFSNICDRQSCYNCRFKKRYRLSDITIWDCFQPQRLR